MIIADIQNKTIGELVAEDYRMAEVFKRNGIDFCCGGKKTLSDVCLQKGIEPALLVKALTEIHETPTVADSLPADSWPLPFLCDYIVQVHHTYTKEKLPMMLEYARKVAKVHGHAWPENIAIADHCTMLLHEMTEHMAKEEGVLFPYIKHLAEVTAQGGKAVSPPFGSVANPIAMMESEHESAGDAMKQIRALSHNYTPPEGACNTYRVLYKLLEEFEGDLHRHVHLENNILFPKAIALEQSSAIGHVE